MAPSPWWDVPQAQIDEYLEECGLEPDLQIMKELIVQRGMSAWKAARVRADSGLSDRSFSTLLYFARDLFAYAVEDLGTPVHQLVSELIRDGSVHVPRSQATMVRQAARDAGLRFHEDVRFTVD